MEIIVRFAVKGDKRDGVYGKKEGKWYWRGVKRIHIWETVGKVEKKLNHRKEVV